MTSDFRPLQQRVAWESSSFHLVILSTSKLSKISCQLDFVKGQVKNDEWNAHIMLPKCLMRNGWGWFYSSWHWVPFISIISLCFAEYFSKQELPFFIGIHRETVFSFVNWLFHPVMKFWMQKVNEYNYIFHQLTLSRCLIALPRLEWRLANSSFAVPLNLGDLL